MPNRVECPFLIQDPVTGSVVNGAAVTIKIRDSSTLASLYLSESGGSQANPVTTVNGRIPAWADPGSYDLTIVGSNFSTTRTWEAIRGDSIANIATGTIGTSQLIDNSVSTSKLQDASVTSSKLNPSVRADQAFTTQKLYGRWSAGNDTGAFIYPDTYVLHNQNVLSTVSTDDLSGGGLFYFDPSVFAITGRTLNLYLNMIIQLGGGGFPAFTIQTGMFPASAGTGLGVTTLALGSRVAGSTVSVTPTGAQTISRVTTGAFTAPAAGFYVLGFILSGFSGGSAFGNFSVVESLHYSNN